MKHLYIAADKIEAAQLGEIGVDLFIGTLPHDVQTGVMLKDPLFGAEVDEGMRGFFTHHFMVIVRHPDAKAGYDRARAIGRALETRREQVDGLFILRMSPAALPVSYPKGDADDIETSLRVNVAFGELP